MEELLRRWWWWYLLSLENKERRVGAVCEINSILICSHGTSAADTFAYELDDGVCFLDTRWAFVARKHNDTIAAHFDGNNRQKVINYAFSTPQWFFYSSSSFNFIPFLLLITWAVLLATLFFRTKRHLQHKVGLQ